MMTLLRNSSDPLQCYDIIYIVVKVGRFVENWFSFCINDDSDNISDFSDI